MAMLSLIILRLPVIMGFHTRFLSLKKNWYEDLVIRGESRFKNFFTNNILKSYLILCISSQRLTDLGSHGTVIAMELKGIAAENDTSFLNAGRSITLKIVAVKHRSIQ